MGYVGASHTLYRSLDVQSLEGRCVCRNLNGTDTLQDHRNSRATSGTYWSSMSASGQKLTSSLA
jgi:hypothetical protein